MYLVHLPRRRRAPVEEIMRGCKELARAGKILCGGLSDFPAWRVAAGATLADLRGWAPLAGVQLGV
ncbi:MAG: aldo/keto reductase [Hymenobacter sp.]